MNGLAVASGSREPITPNPRYEQILDLVKKRLNAVPGVGHRVPQRLVHHARLDDDEPVGRLAGHAYTHVHDIFHMKRPSETYPG